ncbi:hypothetical protein PQD17_gp68 [Pantoea phage PdC23]|uniref:Uncharacterized protein n=1 Tax=Pantoea phage PdC23 TaxID=2894356 RepID=A0AAE9C7X8_9CAUD|nr:hypothetical protein PQD17_gp68 [Pantoea phage PdC23]UGC97781.1 hypothetical protein pdc_068 [Pantoea phage PdC23]
MIQVTHGLARKQLTGLTFNPTDRLLKALIENRDKYTISKDGIVTPKFETIKSAAQEFGDSRSEKGGKNK